MALTPRLVFGDKRLFVAHRSYIAQRLAETTVAELVGTAEELDRMAGTEGREAELHRPVMLVTQRQNVLAHGEESSIVAAHCDGVPEIFDSNRLQCRREWTRSALPNCFSRF